MKTFLLSIVIFSILFSVQSVFAQPEPQIIPGQYIVILKESAARGVIFQQTPAANDRARKFQLNHTTRQANLATVRKITTQTAINPANILAQYADVTVGFAAKLSDANLRALKTNPDVAGIYPDYAVSVSYSATAASECSDYGSYRAQVTTCAITKAGGFANGAGKPAWIWILDTGIDLTHPDLNVQTNATYAKSFIAGPNVKDLNGHGTHVAGIAAAKNNTIGVVGVSAGATVVPVKVLANSGTGAFSAILSGLNHVAQHDIQGDVVNLSIGAYPIANCENSNPAIRNAIKALGNAGTHVVMASGNNAGNATFNFPGCVNGVKVYTVGSITCSNTCSGFANWGAPPLDWVAVGSDVYSTYKSGGYATLSGTSMAAPVVAGIIHARGGAPVSAGNVICGGAVKKIAKR